MLTIFLWYDHCFSFLSERIICIQIDIRKPKNCPEKEAHPKEIGNCKIDQINILITEKVLHEEVSKLSTKKHN